MNVDERADIRRRIELRRELINLLTRSTGDVKLAEYCVNSLTIHHPDVLARAALLFGQSELQWQTTAAGYPAREATQ